MHNPNSILKYMFAEARTQVAEATFRDIHNPPPKKRNNSTSFSLIFHAEVVGCLVLLQTRTRTCPEGDRTLPSSSSPGLPSRSEPRLPGLRTGLGSIPSGSGPQASTHFCLTNKSLVSAVEWKHSSGVLVGCWLVVGVLLDLFKHGEDD